MTDNALIIGLLLVAAAAIALFVWRKGTAQGRRHRRRQQRRERFDRREMIDMFGEKPADGTPE